MPFSKCSISLNIFGIFRWSAMVLIVVPIQVILAKQLLENVWKVWVGMKHINSNKSYVKKIAKNSDLLKLNRLSFSNDWGADIWIISKHDRISANICGILNKQKTALKNRLNFQTVFLNKDYNFFLTISHCLFCLLQLEYSHGKSKFLCSNWRTAWLSSNYVQRRFFLRFNT